MMKDSKQQILNCSVDLMVFALYYCQLSSQSISLSSLAADKQNMIRESGSLNIAWHSPFSYLSTLLFDADIDHESIPCFWCFPGQHKAFSAPMTSWSRIFGSLFVSPFKLKEKRGMDSKALLRMSDPQEIPVRDTEIRTMGLNYPFVICYLG
jgi:hypothetical protein